MCSSINDSATPIFSIHGICQLKTVPSCFLSTLLIQYRSSYGTTPLTRELWTVFYRSMRGHTAPLRSIYTTTIKSTVNGWDTGQAVSTAKCSVRFSITWLANGGVSRYLDHHVTAFNSPCAASCVRWNWHYPMYKVLSFPSSVFSGCE